MQCFVYRSRRQPGMYLFLPQADDFSQVPESLLKLFGQPELSFEFELKTGRKLMRADANDVSQHLRDNGFFLQMPPGRELEQ